jgi:hypothetical protein
VEKPPAHFSEQLLPQNSELWIVPREQKMSISGAQNCQELRVQFLSAESRPDG